MNFNLRRHIHLDPARSWAVSEHSTSMAWILQWERETGKQLFGNLLKKINKYLSVKQEYDKKFKLYKRIYSKN